MLYQLRFTKEAQQQLTRLPGNIRQRVRRLIVTLTHNPKPLEAKQMEDDLADYYRIRFENYRIIYTIDDDIVLIEIIRITKRSPKTYGDLP
jgi:mRNA interferase RelE/StbE